MTAKSPRHRPPRRRPLFWPALALCAAIAACSASDSASVGGYPSDDRIVGADSEPQNWLSHGRTYSEQRFSPLDQIDDGNVGNLKLAWYLDLDTFRGQEGTPLVVDGVMYTTTA